MIGKYKVAIFDFDGTLADTYPSFVRHVDEASEQFRFKRVEPADVPVLRRKSAREVIEFLGIPFWKIPLIARFMRRSMARDVGTIQLFPGVAGMLRELKGSGVELALVTSNAETNVRAILGPELAGLVRTLECGSSLYGKARRFRKVLKRLGLLASEVIYIGDEVRDHQASHAVGIPFGAVSWGYTNPETLRALAPAMMFATVAEIATRLQERD